MVVCKFFQQGSCRYGQNCRFDHIYASKFSYHAPSESTSATPAVTDEQLVNQVQTDLHSMIRGGQWLLSSYAPFKEKPPFPGLVDMSPEEARLFIYEAKANNNLDEAVAFMNNIFQEAKQKYEFILTKNENITKVLRSLYNGENVLAPFGALPQSNPPFGTNNASSVFRNALQPTSPSVFAQNNTPSIFTQNNTPSIFTQNNTPSVFTQNAFTQPADPAKLFAQASQNVFQSQTPNVFVVQSPTQNAPMQQQSIFTQPDTMAQSIFGQTSQNAFAQNANAQPAPNVFKTQNAQNTAASIFANASQSVFSSQPTPFNQPNLPTNVFQKPMNQSGFGVVQNQQQIVANTGVYSIIEDISAEDMEAFQSDDFKMGFIPEVPPPQSLCF